MSAGVDTYARDRQPAWRVLDNAVWLEQYDRRTAHMAAAFDDDHQVAAWTYIGHRLARSEHTRRQLEGPPPTPAEAKALYDAAVRRQLILADHLAEQRSYR